MKRIVSFFMVVMLLCTFSGCGKKQEPADTLSTGGELKSISESEFYAQVAANNNDISEKMLNQLRQNKEANNIADSQVKFAVLSGTDIVVKDKIELKMNLPVAYAKVEGKVIILALGIGNISCESLKSPENVRAIAPTGYATIGDDGSIYLGYKAKVMVYGATYLTKEEYTQLFSSNIGKVTDYGKLNEETGKVSFEITFYGNTVHTIQP